MHHPNYKLYIWERAPNPRRVKIFLHEKGLDVSMEDVGEDGHLKHDYCQRVPHQMVPLLEFEDGTQIGEAMAICRTFEALYPNPPLFGKDPKEIGLVAMWEQRAYEEGIIGAAEIFRNSRPVFAGRSLPGTDQQVPQIAELIERGRGRLARFYKNLDDQLAQQEFIAGSHFSVADITALCAIDFARASKVEISEPHVHLRRWHEAVSLRPSANA